jgi:hypothetical protein
MAPVNVRKHRADPSEIFFLASPLPIRELVTLVSPHLYMPGIEMIPRPTFVLASPGQRSAKIVVADVFRHYFYKRLGFFKACSGTSMGYARGLEVATWFAHGALSRDAGGIWCEVFQILLCYLFFLVRISS